MRNLKDWKIKAPKRENFLYNIFSSINLILNNKRTKIKKQLQNSFSWQGKLRYHKIKAFYWQTDKNMPLSYG